MRNIFKTWWPHFSSELADASSPLSNFCGRIVFESILVPVLFFMFCFVEYSNISGAYLQRIWCRHLQIYLQTLKTCRTDPAGAASGVQCIHGKSHWKFPNLTALLKYQWVLLATNPRKYLTIKYLYQIFQHLKIFHISYWGKQLHGEEWDCIIIMFTYVSYFDHNWP